MLTHWNTVGVLLSDALRLSFALLKWVLVLELGTHDDNFLIKFLFIVRLSYGDGYKSGGER